MIPRALTATRLIDHNEDEIRSIQLLAFEKIKAQKSKRKTSAGF